MKGEIIAIGDELTSGRVLNTTSCLAARRLFQLGHDTVIMQNIGDNPELIGETLVKALGRADFVIVSGGLGSTDDDLTTAAVAHALGLETEHNAVLLDSLLARHKTIAFDQHTLSRLTLLPKGAEVLDNEYRMAGYLVYLHSKPVWFLPGVPSQMEILLETRVIPELQRLAPTLPMQQRIYRTCGLTEMAINAMLRPLEEEQGLQIGYYPVGWEVDISLTVRHRQLATLQSLLDKAHDFIVAKLGNNLFGLGDDSLTMVVGELLKEKNKRLAVAESCTGGLLSSQITEIAGSSQWFSGGAVVYSNALKESILGVSKELLAQYGAVSEVCAREMADQALQRFYCDFALAITGIAGPGGGSTDKPVGTVFVALAKKDATTIKHLELHGSRREIQKETTQIALDIVRRSILTDQ